MFNTSKLLLLIGVFLAILFWIVDAAIDTFVFEEYQSFLESLFFPDAIELWMRWLVVVLLFGFALYVRKILLVLQMSADELHQHKGVLENLVDKRTNELKRINIDLKGEIRDRKKAEKKLELLAITDPLTKLYNRRKFDELFEAEINKCQRYKTDLSLIFCDIDCFKSINDKYGHDEGDNVLKLFSEKIKNILRQSDIVARWGGEEFVLLIPNANVDSAVTLAEKIRAELEFLDFSVAGKMTASFGVTQVFDGDDRKSVIKRADDALYQAKSKGRNRVESLLP